MKLLLIMVVAALTACTTVPVEYSFPDAPAKMMVAPPPLKTIINDDRAAPILLNDNTPSDVKLSAMIKIVTENYKISNQYRELVIELQNWIKEQKELAP
jgi:hypothetical protein